MSTTEKIWLKHLDSMHAWVIDMKKDPNIVWQCRSKDGDDWRDLDAAPLWYYNNEYRRKPTSTFTARIIRDSVIEEESHIWTFSGTKEEFYAGLKKDKYSVVGEVVEIRAEDH